MDERMREPNETAIKAEVFAKYFHETFRVPHFGMEEEKHSEKYIRCFCRVLMFV